MGGEHSAADPTAVASYAYSDKIPDYGRSSHAAILDLLSTPIVSLELHKRPALRQVRATFCESLTRATFSRLPNLEAVDLLSASNLRTLSIDQCPKLRALDLTLTYVTSIPQLDSLEYLSLYCVPEFTFPPLKNLKFLDYSSTSGSPFPNLDLFPQLEVLSFHSPVRLQLSAISAHPTLRVFNGAQLEFVFDSVAPGTHLQFLSLHVCTIIGDITSATDSGIFVGLTGNKFHGTFDPNKLRNFQYISAARVLYGPWGVPSIDASPLPSPPAVIHPPDSCSTASAVDGVAGAIFGGAVADWIGLGSEFVDGSIAKCWLPEPLDITWSHARVWRHNMRFLRGTPTDDTSQAILILRSLVDTNSAPAASPTAIEYGGVRIDVADFGCKLSEWVEHGHAEHKHPGGLGCGGTTYQTLSHPEFARDPIAAARAVWEAGGRAAAPNGSVMRVSTSGAFGFWDEGLVKTVADAFGRATHPDPRCVFATRAVGLLIARFLQAGSGLRGEVDVDAVLAEARVGIEGIEEHEADVEKYSHAKTVEELELSGNAAIGYCLKTFGSAVWAARYAKSFEDGIAQIVREGGDADTNASAAGAVLGAKFGFKGIPREFVDFMAVGQWLWREIVRFLELMGLPPPPSPYLQGEAKSEGKT